MTLYKKTIYFRKKYAICHTLFIEVIIHLEIFAAIGITKYYHPIF